MSGIELNKIVAAILLASLIAMLVGFVANILYKPKLQVSQRGYHLEVEEASATNAGETKEIPVDIKALMAKANAEAGAGIIKKCVSCHSFDNGGANTVGPNLWKVAGGSKAHKKDFAYSKALQAAEKAIKSLTESTRKAIDPKALERLSKRPYCLAAGGIDSIIAAAARECVGYEDAAKATIDRVHQLCGVMPPRPQQAAEPAAPDAPAES
jgi:cytochrome c2